MIHMIQTYTKEEDIKEAFFIDGIVQVVHKQRALWSLALLARVREQESERYVFTHRHHFICISHQHTLVFQQALRSCSSAGERAGERASASGRL